jgi:DNA-binding IclR family transcriptional regulator
MVRPALAATRAIDILNFFAAHPGGTFTLSELSASLDINLASALSVLQSLEDAGYLVRHPRRKTYELGPSLVALGDAALRSNRAVDLARVEMRTLAEEFNTEAIISVAVGDDLVILAVEGRPQLSSADVRVGQRMPLVPPLGQVFFAWSPPDEGSRWRARHAPKSARRWSGWPTAPAKPRGCATAWRSSRRRSARRSTNWSRSTPTRRTTSPPSSPRSTTRGAWWRWP